MAKSTTPDNTTFVFKTLEELDAEFDRDEDGNIIDRPLLPTGASPESVSWALRNPVPKNNAGLVPGSSEGSGASPARPFTAEIEALRIDLQRLQLAFECTTSIEDHHQLASTMNLITASIARLVRAQDTLIHNRPVEFNRVIKADLDLVMKEWGRSG